MNKYKKIGLTALAGSLVAGSLLLKCQLLVVLLCRLVVVMKNQTTVTVGQWLTQ